ncbi:MAG TPA: glycosyltransferase family 4 protein [Thermoanaerobaculia bacterium]|nr:glycosyltransferase family 4 protein [Thermoanaerobaculia bacterium]
MRVLLIANTLPPRDVSGVGEQVLQLAAGLRELGDEVEVLGRGPGGAAGPKVLFSLSVVPAVWRVVRRFRPHVVQVHESDGALAALVVKALGVWMDPRPLVAALFQVSYVEELRAVRPLVAGGRVLGWPGAVERRFRWLKAPLQILLGQITARAADLVLAPSAATAAEIRRDYRVDEVGVIPNATGGLVVESAAETDGGGYLLFVGRLRIRKGVEVLLEALRELRRRRPGTALRIAGDGEHRESLERAVADLGLETAVSFLGTCDAARVRTLLRGAAALVVPSIYEGMPLVVLEAMEVGVPVVASRVSGIPEVVVHGETGWLVPPEDPQALAAALESVVGDPGEARRRGEAGRRRVAERYRPAIVAAAWREAVLARGMVE